MARRPVGHADGMDKTPEPQDRDLTAPPNPTHEASVPPGNGERDDDAVERGKEKLEQAGGGH